MEVTEVSEFKLKLIELFRSRQGSPDVYLELEVLLPFAPYDGLVLIFDNGVEFPVDLVSWNVEKRYFDCSRTNIGDDAVNIASIGALRQKGWDFWTENSRRAFELLTSSKS